MENKDRIVRSVVVKVLEDAAFMFCDDFDKADRPDPASWEARGISLKFSGKPSGCFRLWADRKFALLLAANMLGVDEGEEGGEQKAVDALKEILNIIAGNALTELFGVSAVFNLGIPEAACESLIKHDCARDDGIWLITENFRILCIVEIYD